MAISKDIVAALYVAMFSRAPEGEGLENWYKAAIENNWTEAQLAESMLRAAEQVVSSNEEYEKIYPQYVDVNPQDPESVRKIITTVYENVLGKGYDEDPEGIDGWVNAVVKGEMTIGGAVAGIIDVALTHDWSDDPEAQKAVETLKNRIEFAKYFAEKVKKFYGDFTKYREIIMEVTDDKSTLETAKQKVDKYYIVKNVSLTTGKDEITGSVFDDKFKAGLLTLNDGDKIEDPATDDDDVLEAQINSNVSAQVTIKNVENLDFTSYGSHQIDMKNISGAKYVKTVDSTGQLTIVNIASTDTGIGLKGLNQNINATYDDLTGANDELKLVLEEALNAQITVNSGFETAAIKVNGDSSIKSFTNNPKKITVTGTGNLKLDDGGAGDALGNNSIKLFDASGLKGSVTTGKDTNNDGFVDNEKITTDAEGAVIKLTNNADNVYINDGSNAGKTNTVFLGEGDDKLALKKASGTEVVFGGAGDDKIKVLNASTAALTTSDIFDMGEGSDTLIIDNSQNNNFVVKGLESLILTKNASGTNTVTSDTAIAVTAKVDANNVDIRGLHSGSTVKVENAKNATGGVNNLTVAFAQPEDASTIEVNTKVNGGNTLTLQNIKEATVNFNSTVGSSSSLYAIDTKGVNKLTLNTAKAAYFGAETDLASTNTLESIRIVGQDVVKIGNLTSSALKTVDINAKDALDVGTITASNLLSSVKLVSTGSSVDFDDIGGSTVTELSNVTIKAKANVGSTTFGTIDAIKIGDVSIEAETGTLTVDDIGSAATQFVNSITLKSAGDLTANNIYSLDVGSTITLESTNGNIAVNDIHTKDKDGIDVVLKTSSATGTIDDGGGGNVYIKNTDGNINSITLAAKGTVKVKAEVDDSGTTGGYYVKSVDATGVTGDLNLTVINADDSTATSSTTTIKLGGTTNTNSVTVLGKVDTLNITGSAGADNITIGDASDASTDEKDTFKSGTIDLGAGTDKVDFTNYDNLDSSGHGLIINIDTTAHTVDGKVVSAGEVIEKDNNASDGTYNITKGTDLYLKNVENVVGTDEDDVIFGNAGNNILEGGDGNDIIKGGDGNDIITTGSGRDIINTKVGAAYSLSNIDTITDFTTGSSGDKLQISVSDVEAISSVDDLVTGNSTSVSAGTSVDIQEISLNSTGTDISADTTLGATKNVIVLTGKVQDADGDGDIDSVDLLNVVGNAGTSNKISWAGTGADNDAIIVVWADGTDAHVGVVADSDAGTDATWETADLSYQEIAKLSGIDAINSGDFDAANFEFIT